MTGQIIPKGLHVRLNLETGEKEAKLMSSRPHRSAGIEQNVILMKNISCCLWFSLVNIQMWTLAEGNCAICPAVHVVLSQPKITPEIVIFPKHLME